MADLGPIDLVYTWCDAADPKFRAKRDALAAELGVPLKGGANGSCRYVSNDELRYSLRSVERFMPWIRTVILVIDDDIAPPAWLDAAAGGLRIVRLGEIMSARHLPCFNSTSIEFHLPCIPALSERFIYSNDDMFVGGAVTPDFFFAADGYPYFRYGDTCLDMDGTPPDDNFLFRVWKSFRFIRSEFGVSGDFGRAFGHLSHHNMDAYCRSDMLAFRDRYADFVESTVRHPFRCSDQYQREVFNCYAMAVGHGHYRRNKRPWYETLFGGAHRDSYYFAPGRATVARDMKRIRPKLFCMNDHDGLDAEDRAAGRAFLETLFPDRSRYERTCDDKQA